MPVFKRNLLDPLQELSLHQGVLWDAHMTPERHNFLFQKLREWSSYLDPGCQQYFIHSGVQKVLALEPKDSPGGQAGDRKSLIDRNITAQSPVGEDVLQRNVTSGKKIVTSEPYHTVGQSHTRSTQNYPCLRKGPGCIFF